MCVCVLEPCSLKSEHSSPVRFRNIETIRMVFIGRDCPWLVLKKCVNRISQFAQRLLLFFSFFSLYNQSVLDFVGILSVVGCELSAVRAVADSGLFTVEAQEVLQLKSVGAAGNE